MRSSKQKYTLIELLVTITIIGILSVMLISAMKVVQVGEERFSCVENLKLLGQGVALFNGDNAGAYPLQSKYVSKNNYVGWDKYIYPYVSTTGIIPKDTGRLKEGVALDIFQCPAALSAPISGLYYHQSYGMPRISVYNRDAIGVYESNNGPNYGSSRSYRYQFYRRTSNVAPETLLLTEIDADNYLLGQGNGRSIINPERQVKVDSDGYSSRATNCTSEVHGEGSFSINNLLCDGRVKFLRYDDEFLIGQGTPTKPQGAWTIDPND